MLNEIISAILQIGVFTFIPFLVFVINRKATKGFFDYIGLKPAPARANYLAALTALVFVAGAVGLVSADPAFKAIMTNPPSITGKLRTMGLGPQSIIILLVTACFKTALAEEIFFRGFVAKRLINWLGYRLGNLLQATIFAGIHVLLFWSLAHAGAGFLLFIFLFTGVAGYFIGYIKEKVGNGSIVPGWIAHGLGNTISYFVIAFLI